MDFKFKIYPEYKLIVIVDNKIESKNHFYNMFKSIHSHQLFDSSYNFLIDGRLTNWGEVSAADATAAIELIHIDQNHYVFAAYVVQNIGQIAFTEVIFDSTRTIDVEYFYSIKSACEYLKVPETLDILQ